MQKCALSTMSLDSPNPVLLVIHRHIPQERERKMKRRQERKNKLKCLGGVSLTL